MNDMQGKKILVVDDDPDVLRLLVHTFSLTDAQVLIANCGEEALRQFYIHRPDLIVLDVKMPDIDGWQVCLRICDLADVPIIFLTALGGPQEIISGLDCGAVDYVTKPFSPEVLIARARAALRPMEMPLATKKPATYADDYLTIDLEERRVLVRGRPINLTATEFQLLTYLVQNAERVLTFRQILENVWGWEYRDSTNYAHVYIWHLRQKLEEDPKNPQYLLTEHGVGYRFHAPSSNGVALSDAQPIHGEKHGR
jgi:two-component system KDP operon response regulator KdpE